MCCHMLRTVGRQRLRPRRRWTLSRCHESLVMLLPLRFAKLPSVGTWLAAVPFKRAQAQLHSVEAYWAYCPWLGRNSLPGPARGSGSEARERRSSQHEDFHTGGVRVKLRLCQSSSLITQVVGCGRKITQTMEVPNHVLYSQTNLDVGLLSRFASGCCCPDV